ncbi:MAG: hypothetical protein ABI592_00290 [Acidobacteriota bacterium]
MQRRTKPLLMTGLLLAFAVAGVVYELAWTKAPFIANDTAGYLRAASAIAHGATNPERPPGYPLLLLATGSTTGPTRLLFHVSLLFHAGSVLLIAAVLRSIGLRPSWIAAACLVMLLPPYVQMAAWALTETLAAFCLALLFWSIHRYWQTSRLWFLTLASLAAGYAATTKPTFEFLAPALGVALAVLAFAMKPHGWNWKRIVRDAVWLAAGTIVIAGGRSAINYAKSGYFGQTSLLGYTLAGRTCMLWEQVPDPLVRGMLVEARRAAALRRENLSWSVFTIQPELMKATGKTEEELGKYLEAMSVRLIRSYPEAYLEDGARSFAEFWFPISGGLPLMRSPLVRLVWYGLSWAVFCGFFASLAVAFGLVARAVVERAPPFGPVPPNLAAAWVAAASIVVYTAVISSAVAWGDPRFRAAVDLMLLATIAITAQILWRLRILRGSLPTSAEVPA